MTESQDPAVTRPLLARLEAEKEKALQAARSEILAWQKQFAEVNEVKDRLRAENERLRDENQRLLQLLVPCKADSDPQTDPSYPKTVDDVLSLLSAYIADCLPAHLLGDEYFAAWERLARPVVDELMQTKDHLQFENEQLHAQIKRLQALSDAWLVWGLGPRDYEAGK